MAARGLRPTDFARDQWSSYHSRSLGRAARYGLVTFGDEMSVFDFFLVAFSLAPLGLFILFWKLFHEDRGVHPIYRKSTTETTKLGQRSRT